jgi:hypothetical protein
MSNPSKERHDVMSIQNLPPETQAAIDALYGTDTASPVAQAVAAAAQQLQQQHAGQLESKRLAAAMQLVLGNAVTLHLDGSSSVHSGKLVYSQQGGACSCPDHQQRGSFCKHLIAVALYRLAQGQLSQPLASELLQPAAASAWDVHEAPVSCYLKFRVGHLELSYTMRDVDDAHLAARLTHVLPKVNALAEAEAARSQQQAAELALARQAAKPAGDLQQLVQHAVQQALAGGDSGQQPPAEPQAPEANANGDTWCALHAAWMPERSNAQGSWHSHPAQDEQGEYYCKGSGRQRRSR